MQKTEYVTVYYYRTINLLRLNAPLLLLLLLFVSLKWIGAV